MLDRISVAKRKRQRSATTTDVWIYRCEGGEMKKAVVLGCLILLVAGCYAGAGCGSKKQTVATSQTAKSKAATTKVYSAGETAKCGDLAITVYGFQLVSNNLYLGVDVQIENKGTKTETISKKEEMSIMTSDGKEYGVAPYVPDPAFPDGELKAGDKARGLVAFEFPSSAKSGKFVFNSGTGNVVRFK